MRVSTQSDRQDFRLSALRRVRAAAVPLACLLFVVAAAAMAVAVPAGGANGGTGVIVDPTGKVVSVEPGSGAWGAGVRPGWIRMIVQSDGMTLYELGGDTRPVPASPFTSDVPVGALLAPPLLLLLLAGLLWTASQRRTAATVALAGAVLASAIWETRLGVFGQAMAVAPVGLAAALAWQTGDTLRMWPWQSRPLSARMLGAVVVVGIVPVVAFGAAAAARGLVAGVAVGSVFYAAIAWIVVVRWRSVIEAAGPEPLTGRALARAVAFDMLPFSDRVRGRGAQAERDRLASDLHAEVLPAIASAAAALEQRGAVGEAEQLRGLVASVRDLVSDRRLPILDDQGIVAAAEWLAESLQERAALTIEISLGGETGSRRPQAVERAAYRVLQLALENVIRHARAANAFVDIAGDAHSLDLAVADDGCGIEKDAAARALHDGRLGLADMRREAESVGASLAIASRSPRGTVVGMRWRA